MATRPAQPKKNDLARRAPLSSGTLRPPVAGGPSAGLAGAVAGTPLPGESPDEYVERADGEWNERIDGDVQALAEGLKSMVAALKVPSRPPPSSSFLPLLC